MNGELTENKTLQHLRLTECARHVLQQCFNSLCPKHQTPVFSLAFYNRCFAVTVQFYVLSKDSCSYPVALSYRHKHKKGLVGA